MEKVINIKITKCEDCPYLQYNCTVSEKECRLLDKLLFFDDYNDKNVKDTYSEPIIYKDCPLETSEGEKTETSESNAILPDVSQQREPLKAFMRWQENQDIDQFDDQPATIDRYLENL